MLQIGCCCKQLVEVIDKQVVYHMGVDNEICPASGMKYVSKKISSGYVGGPTIEVVATKEIGCTCGENCGATGVGALLKLTNPDPNLN